MSDSLIPIVLTVAAAVGVAGAILALSAVFGRPRKSMVDPTPYECGSKPFTPVQGHRYSVKFYLVAMLFILFDIEAAFLIPWAVTFKSFAADKAFVLGEMLVFLGILVAGYLYLLWRGALEWE